jgi:murein L,D-transpeptidase YcbB/YkuD
MKATKQFLPIAVALLATFITGCSQQQVANPSQVADTSQISPAQVSQNCPMCNMPEEKPVKRAKQVKHVKPQPKVHKRVVRKRVARKPVAKRVYKPRRFVPTVPTKKTASHALVARIQGALKAKGYNPGPVDGRMGPRTIAALSAFQKARRLPTGQLNRATLRALGLM